MFKRLVHSAFVFGMVALAPPALAQTYCAARDDIVASLGETYSEAPAAGGLISERRLLEIWAAPQTGTWTVLMTDAQGQSCILASGTDWHQQRATIAAMGEQS